MRNDTALISVGAPQCCCIILIITVTPVLSRELRLIYIRVRKELGQNLYPFKRTIPNKQKRNTAGPYPTQPHWFHCHPPPSSHIDSLDFSSWDISFSPFLHKAAVTVNQYYQPLGYWSFMCLSGTTRNMGHWVKV